MLYTHFFRDILNVYYIDTKLVIILRYNYDIISKRVIYTIRTIFIYLYIYSIYKYSIHRSRHYIVLSILYGGDR